MYEKLAHMACFPSPLNTLAEWTLPLFQKLIRNELIGIKVEEISASE